MAAQTEEIILEVKVEGSIDKVASLKQSINELIKLREELTAKSKEGDLQATKALEAVNVAIRTQQQEYRTQTKVIDGYVAAKKTEINTSNLAANSIQQNRDLLKQLTAQYIGLKNPSANATSQIAHLTEVLKKQEAAIGDTRRNVGNYAEGFRTAFSSIGKVAQGVGINVEGISTALSGGGIGVAIGVFTTLINVFKEFGGVADKIEQVTAGISGGFKAFITGGNAVEAGVQIANLTAELQQLNEESERSVLANERINASIKHLEVAARDRTKTEEERIGLLEEANKLALKQFQLDTERLNQKAKLDEDVFAKKNNLSKLEVDVALENNETIKKAYDFLTDKQIEATRSRVGQTIKLDGDEVKGLINNRVELSKTEERYQDVLDKNAVRSNKLADERDAKAQKLADAQKARNEKLIAEQAAYQKNIEDLETEFNLSTREKLAKTFEDKLATITGNGQREIALRISIEQEKESALSKFDSDLKSKRDEIEGKRVQKEYLDNQKVMEQLRMNAEMQIDLQKTTRETQQQIDDEYAASNYATFREFYDAKKKLYKEDADAQSQAEATKIRAQEANLNAAETISNSIVGLVQTVADAQGAGAETAKAIGLVQIAISEGVAIANAVLGATAAGAATGPAAIGTIPAYIVTLIATTVASIGSAIALLSKPIPQAHFAQGDEITSFLIGGKPHSRGGTKFYGEDGNVFEAEAGERAFIMKKTAADKINLLSEWNQFWGGKSWNGPTVKHAASGGAVTDGGFAIRETSRGGEFAMAVENAVKSAFKIMPQPVVSVQEINAVNKSRNQSVGVSEL
jgi:hypothetical protein